MPSYQKLVRDRIPEIIRDNDEIPKTCKLSEPQYKEALADKLVEEATEVREAGPEEIMKELADVSEVIESLLKVYGIDRKEMIKYKKEKRSERGGFEKRIFLEDVTSR